MQFKTILKSFIDSPEFEDFLGYIHYREDVEDVIGNFVRKSGIITQVTI